MLHDFVVWLGQTPGSIALHESLYMYAVIETAHVIGIMLFVGTIAMVDLRVLGVSFRQMAVSELLARILPWTIGGFIFMLLTGVLLFYGIPDRTYHSVWFRIKVVLLIIGAINIWLFHRRVERDIHEWDTGVTPPLNARLVAAVSLSVWLTIIVMGRFIAYNWYDCDRPQSDVVKAFAGCTKEAL
ncbi:MAG TPA: DUF6644 family protein [Phenylobacterium sp.]